MGVRRWLWQVLGGGIDAGGEPTFDDDDWAVVFDGRPGDAKCVSRILVDEGGIEVEVDVYVPDQGLPAPARAAVSVRASEAADARDLILASPYLGNVVGAWVDASLDPERAAAAVEGFIREGSLFEAAHWATIASEIESAPLEAVLDSLRAEGFAEEVEIVDVGRRNQNLIGSVARRSHRRSGLDPVGHGPRHGRGHLRWPVSVDGP